VDRDGAQALPMPTVPWAQATTGRPPEGAGGQGSQGQCDHDEPDENPAQSPHHRHRIINQP
ncbi:MAG: hypothetical protein ACKN9D_12190, partial [Actinomycetales bacterium]